jgi:predicted transcriptional regulator
MNENSTPNYIDLAAGIVSAFVSNNSVQRSDLAALISDVHAALKSVGTGNADQPKIELVPAVQIKKSITPDHIICLEDGKKFKSLKRHLRTAYSMTPDQYRTKWGLPSDYPMVAPKYAAARSELARSMGLGQNRKGAAKRRKAA